MLPFHFQLASHANLSAGVPEGGSLGLAESIEARYRRLGGEVSYNTKVESVIVENDRAVGVRLSDGGELRADIVVSACDGYTTTMKFLDGRYLGEDYRKLYTETIHEPGWSSPATSPSSSASPGPSPRATPARPTSSTRRWRPS